MFSSNLGNPSAVIEAGARLGVPDSLKSVLDSTMNLKLAVNTPVVQDNISRLGVTTDQNEAVCSLVDEEGNQMLKSTEEILRERELAKGKQLVTQPADFLKAEAPKASTQGTELASTSARDVNVSITTTKNPGPTNPGYQFTLELSGNMSPRSQERAIQAHRYMIEKVLAHEADMARNAAYVEMFQSLTDLCRDITTNFQNCAERIIGHLCNNNGSFFFSQL